MSSTEIQRGTITVSSRSWHRRLYGFWAREIATSPPATPNLCLYMRVLLIYLPVIALVVAVVGIVVAIVGIVFSPIWVPIWLLCRHRTWWKGIADFIAKHFWKAAMAMVFIWMASVMIHLFQEDWWRPFLALGGAVVVIALVVGTIVLVEHLRLRRGRKRMAASGTTAAPTSSMASLGWKWIRAKKARVCPLIKTKES